jgi:hypothetical protein
MSRALFFLMSSSSPLESAPGGAPVVATVRSVRSISLTPELQSLFQRIRPRHTSASLPELYTRLILLI